METRHVAIGGEDVGIREPTVFKAELVLGAVTRIYEQIPDLQDRIDDFIAEHRKREALPRAVAEARFDDARLISEKGWAESGQRFELPVFPSTQEIFVQQLPTLFKLARGDVLRLLALVCLDDEKLLDAEESGGEGGVDELIEAEAKRLRRATITELGKIGEATVELVTELSAGGDEGNLSGLRTIWTRLFGSGQEAQMPSEPSPEIDAEPEPSDRSSSASPNGPSASESPSDGNGGPPSESPSERLATSRDD